MNFFYVKLKGISYEDKYISAKLNQCPCIALRGNMKKEYPKDWCKRVHLIIKKGDNKQEIVFIIHSKILIYTTMQLS